MTELEKEAEEWLDDERKYIIEDDEGFLINISKKVKEAYLAGAEPREKRIAELEKENERLKGDLELWESGACRATNLDKCGVVKELKAQIEKMKCCGNCTKGNCVNIGQKGRACAYWTSNELKEMKEND